MPKQPHTPYCTSRMRLGKEMGMRLQETQAECVVPPWMCPVPGASQSQEDFRGQPRAGTSKYSNSRMLRSSQSAHWERFWPVLTGGSCSRKPPEVMGLTHSRIPASLRGSGTHGQCHLLPQSCPVLCSYGQRGIASLARGSPSGLGHLSLLSSSHTD